MRLMAACYRTEFLVFTPRPEGDSALLTFDRVPTSWQSILFVFFSFDYKPALQAAILCDCVGEAGKFFPTPGAP
jgi:hypothetical protein